MPELDLAPPILWLAGSLLLLAGRRLYWLFVGVAGFVVGFLLAERLVDAGPEWTSLLVALLLGAVVSLLAVFFQKVAVAGIGFLGAAALVLTAGDALAWQLGNWIWLVAVAAGIVGALLTRALFELGLIVLSSLAGAALVVQGTTLLDPEASIALALLAGFGMLVQLLSRRRIGRRRG